MAGLRETIATLLEGQRLPDWQQREALSEGVVEIADFGANPGNLRMLAWTPADVAPGAPLVVVLHGCLQDAVSHATATGWTELARKHGFALLLPQQQRENNSHFCFNWFEPDDIARGGGEAASVREMIERMIGDHRLDRGRVYVCGLSAGGSMACALLAAYPEVFAGGGVIAGLPYRSAQGAKRALEVMAHPQERSERIWGYLVRSASGHRGPWPTISIWHGEDDRVVDPANADALAAQWRNVHGLAETAAVASELGGHTRSVWHDSRGRPALELVRVRSMGHGTPIDSLGRRDEPLGSPQRFVLDVGLSSTWHLARNWQLVPSADSAEWISLPTSPPGAGTAGPVRDHRVSLDEFTRRAGRALLHLFAKDRTPKPIASDWRGDWEVRADSSESRVAGPLFTGRAAAAIGGPGIEVRRVLRRRIAVGPDEHLTYQRKLDLRAPVHLLSAVRFEVHVDGANLQREALAFGTRKDQEWRTCTLDLTAFAGREVELRFEIVAVSNVMMEAVAEAQLRGIAVEKIRRPPA